MFWQNCFKNPLRFSKVWKDFFCITIQVFCWARIFEIFNFLRLLLLKPRFIIGMCQHNYWCEKSFSVKKIPGRNFDKSVTSYAAISFQKSNPNWHRKYWEFFFVGGVVVVGVVVVGVVVGVAKCKEKFLSRAYAAILNWVKLGHNGRAVL